MAFRQDKTISLRRRRVWNVQHIGIERGYQIGNGERGADVPDVRALRLLKNDVSDSAGCNLAVLILKSHDNESSL